jgi:hypothetical protein
LEVIAEQQHRLLCCFHDLYNEIKDETDRRETQDFDNIENIGGEVRSIQTFYEKMWLKEGKKIKYLMFRMDV